MKFKFLEVKYKNYSSDCMALCLQIKNYRLKISLRQVNIKNFKRVWQSFVNRKAF